MTPEEAKVFNCIDDSIQIERKGRILAPPDLPSTYAEFKMRYFGSRVPELSEDFICVFAPLPRDAVSACLLQREADKVGVTKGIRVNEKLKDFHNDAKVALLHEMIHATGIQGHGGDFMAEITRLFVEGAYTEPLIL